MGLGITWYTLLKLIFYPSLWSKASVLIDLVAYYSSPLSVFPLLIKSCNKVYFCIIKPTTFEFFVQTKMLRPLVIFFGWIYPLGLSHDKCKVLWILRICKKKKKQPLRSIYCICNRKDGRYRGYSNGGVEQIL